MSVFNFPFSGGVTGVPGYGDRWYIGFKGTWQLDETWEVNMVTSEGDITLGAGQASVPGSAPTYVKTLAERIYMALGRQFNFSDNENPLGWEVQDAGAGFIQYNSQYGGQDTVQGFGSLQGLLVVVGTRTCQLWVYDGDPNNFQLKQILDNVGTFAPDSIQQLGELDVVMADVTGIRSIRARELTQDAYVDDLGSPVDNIIQTALAGLDSTIASKACSIVEPSTKNYWLYLNGIVYVFSRHPSSKIAAWSTYDTKDNNGNAMVPQKFVAHESRVYVRAATGLYLYGGPYNTSYDKYSQVTFQTPYLFDKRPGEMKVFTAVSAVMEGAWVIKAGTDPQSKILSEVYEGGSQLTPDELLDSTFDTGRIPINQHGTHISFQGQSNNQSFSQPAIFGSLLVYYNQGNVQ